MNKGLNPHATSVVDLGSIAIEEMKDYCSAHPQSPSALHHPQLLFRGDLWIALLGPNIEDGVVGIGSSVAQALRAFDQQCLLGRKPLTK